MTTATLKAPASAQAKAPQTADEARALLAQLEAAERAQPGRPKKHKFRLLAGHHVEPDPSGRMRPDNPNVAENIFYPQGSIIETDHDLSRLNAPGVPPKFERVVDFEEYYRQNQASQGQGPRGEQVPGGATSLPATATIWDSARETRAQFNARMDALEAASKEQARLQLPKSDPATATEAGRAQAQGAPLPSAHRGQAIEQLPYEQLVSLAEQEEVDTSKVKKNDKDALVKAIKAHLGLQR